jgi:hypothetical protein
MPLSAEQRKHLETSWQNIQMRANDAAVKNQIELVSLARAKKNTAAVPGAYSKAALYRLETTVRDQLAWTLDEIAAMGVIVDDDVERFLMQHFFVMTSMSMPLHFPPGINWTIDVSPHQREHARARMRLNNQLHGEASAAIRSLKLRAHPTTPAPSLIINSQFNQFHNSPGARAYNQSTDDSSNYLKMPPDVAVLISTLSTGYPELEELSKRLSASADRKSMLEKLVGWVAAASSVEALTEKIHVALPTIEAWIRHLS